MKIAAAAAAAEDTPKLAKNRQQAECKPTLPQLASYSSPLPTAVVSIKQRSKFRASRLKFA
ncbi:hypothetical protein T07_11184 [Trichinella nelsoni]|uniref:Uncharacterized protein n=1 Tax=Trichinella nelsoni TaxID=6336 RepID=A0A0V0SG13_9BILA|nr:hypothetical protein T07_11184 [Trichinella nelsoni]